MTATRARLALLIGAVLAATAVLPMVSAAAATADVCTAKRVSTGQVQIATSSPITALDPSGNQATVAPVRAGMPSFAVWDSIVLVDTKNKILLRGPAQSLTSNSAGTEWTLKLKTGITFGNGDPVNAAAVKASMERYGTSPSQLKPNYDANITSVTAPNDTTVVFTMKQPWTKFPEDFLAQDAGKLLNVPLIKAKGQNDFALGKVTGTGIGAYDIVSWTPNESLILKAKDNWWGGKLCIPELKFVTLGTDDLSYAAIVNGQVSGGFVSDPAILAQAQEKKFQTVPAPTYGPIMIVNQRAGTPGADPRVREAMHLALDTKLVASRAFPTVKDASLVAPTRSYIPTSDPNFNKNVKLSVTNADKAKKLLDTVKAEGKYDGKLDLIHLPTTPYPAVAQAIQAQFNAVGFNVTTTPATDTVNRYNVTRNYQLALGAGGTSPGNYIVNLQIYTASNLNAPGWSNPQYDSLINGLSTAPSSAAFTKTLTEISNIISTDKPFIPLLTISHGAIVNPTLHGVYGRGGLLVFDKAYVSKKG